MFLVGLYFMGDVEIELENQNQLTLKRFTDGVTLKSVNRFLFNEEY